jgi:GT2 family glycosyltransferase
MTEISGGVELIVVDNGSRDGTAAFVRERFAEAHVIEISENRGFTPAVCLGIERARGDWIALLNDDVTVEPQALAILVDVGQSDPDIGSVAVQMRFASRPQIINSAGIEVDSLGVASDRLLGRPITASETTPVEVFGVSGGAAVYRRQTLESIGGFDSSFFGYLEDVDVAWRARMRGWRAVYAPTAVAYHHHSATFRHGSPEKYFLVGRNRIRLLAKNADRRHLQRHGILMIGYDLAYVTFACLRARTLAPVRGRLAGLREWRRYRDAGKAYRREIPLARPSGLRGALGRYRAWGRGTRAPKRLAR